MQSAPLSGGACRRGSSYTQEGPVVRVPVVFHGPRGRTVHPVLVVEDDRDVRHTIKWALEDEGLSVETAADGQEALEVAARTRPGLVLLDMGLPIVDGYGVASGLRQTYGDSVPILLITADGRAAEKARRVGARTYLHKPFDIDHLVEAVQRLLQD